MHRECQERFPRHRLKVHHTRAVMHAGIVSPRWRENVPGISGAYTTGNLVKGPWRNNVPNIYYSNIDTEYIFTLTKFSWQTTSASNDKIATNWRNFLWVDHHIPTVLTTKKWQLSFEEVYQTFLSASDRKSKHGLDVIFMRCSNVLRG